jgi:hypothetical protein
VDGSAVVYDDASFVVSGAGSGMRPTLCGFFTPPSAGVAQTFSLQTKVSSGTVTITTGSNVSSIRWRIKPIDQQIPAPLLVGAVTAPYAGVTHTAVAKLNCDSGSSIISQLGSWVSSIGNVSTGACAVTITAGTFSSAPYCNATATGNTGAGLDNGLIMNVDATSATAVSVDCETDASNACTSFDFILTCTGAK